MNRTGWEYMRVWFYSSTEVSRPGQSQTWSQEYWISRPGAEREQLAAASVDFDVLLNEVGAEGWELVAPGEDAADRSANLDAPAFAWLRRLMGT